ncbi:MAG: hypothetical protein ACJ8EY_01860 [Sphingomicrobium sp.]
MLDVAGGLFVAGYLGSILLAILGRARQARITGTTTILLLLWLVAEISVASTAPLIGVWLPANILMFALTFTLLSAAWVHSPALRRAAAGIPLDSLLALHAWRLGGFFFLLLYAEGRLPWPFAPVAAIGDILTGAGAALLALSLAHGRPVSKQAVGLWNAFGSVDLLLAIALAIMSTPGAPFQLFIEVPAQSAFASLPWLLVPAGVVPALMFVHLAIALRLRGERTSIANNHLSGVAL